MEIRQIKYFLAVQEAGSFTRASEQLFVTQPALSAAIKALEDELGIALLNRLPKRVTLTAAGVKFRDRGLAILAEVQAARRELQISAQQRNSFRIGILNTLNTPPIQRLLRDFSAQYPEIELQISNGNQQTLAQMLGQDKVDILLTNLNSEGQSATSLMLYQERYLLLLAQNHPLAKHQQLYLSDLHGQAFVLRKNCEVLSEAQRLFMMEQAQPHICCRTDQDEWALTMVRCSGAASIMAQTCDHHDLVQIPIADFDLKRSVGCQWRGQRKQDNLQLFIDFAESANLQQHII